MENNNTKSVNFINIFTGLAKAISDSVISTVKPFTKVVSDMKSTVEPLLEAVSDDVISTAISISDSADTIRKIGKDFSEKLFSVVKPVIKTFMT